MPLPLLAYSPDSQNHRVSGFEVAGDEHSRIYNTENILSGNELDMLIMAAYRQIHNEQQMLSSNRELYLESQLRNNQITVREFIRGLILSDSFRRLTFDSNNNYRFVEICVQRVLGRNVYGDREKMAWSIILATQGIQGFVDQLLNSDEYLDNFGDNTVPYQRRRILPQQSTGEVTFNHMARYGTDYRDKLPAPSNVTGDLYAYEPPKSLKLIGAAIIWSGVGLIGFLMLAALLHL
ncbi:phycobilisome rod-core linker polypeptide [filamentous cyanobacterium LEGE 11480]|uniref:Phycobilisome rod-core linker polypeptide n=1 Tax=Romeriopsis navalis LEGE 11480 TaxID=2777977 RepID=A0A928Z3V4_9CYAN|nr:phycobilisome rod-core linker polypeptide [Romeriopsis navalis]MBE9031891.1 phycobilisome rod-core linker polypeptide [Romeriopsis navalis LEGE 11480]